MLGELSSLFQTDIFLDVLNALWKTAPIWLPALLLAVSFDIWLEYKRREWIKNKGSVLLEIKIPREILKTPAAMEVFLNTLYQPGVGSLIDVYLKGRVRSWFSLELVSIDGTVHFFIWAMEDFKSRIETQLYAQFPNIEVREVADYALAVHHDPSKIKFGWFGQFALTKADAYPIKTYIDYGLDENIEEEFKVDPITTVLEYLGSLKTGEQAWIQIMIQAHAKEGIKYGRVFTKPDWKGGIEKEIKDLMKKGLYKDPEDKSTPESKHLSEGQKEVVKAIERTSGKSAFDTMIRATYFAEVDVFNPANIGGLIGSVTQFNSSNLNGFKPGFSAGYDYPWQDFKERRKMNEQRKLLEAYKRRSFFNAPFKNFHGNPFILTTEELATIYHFPSSEVAATPTLSRIPSKKAEAPANLPI